MILSEGSQQRIPGRLFGFPGNAVTLLVPAEIPYGAAIKIEIADTLLLGEALRSAQELDGFRIEVHVAHKLESLSDLRRLNGAILGFEGRRREPGEPVIARRDRTTSS